MSGPGLVNAGAILAGRWQIQDYIGSGDTGEVYGVRDLHSAASFALKLFWPNALDNPEIWTRLQQTARTASGLGVEGVARAYDFGIDANSARPFVVAERVSWSSLAERVRLRGPLTPAEVATALGVLARALDTAHAVGLVHRDLKPENVFIAPENPNWVRVSDFGVTLLRAAALAPPGFGASVGWAAQDAADPKAPATPSMDLFSLGLVVFFALSGGALHRAARALPIDPALLWRELSSPLDSAALRARELGASLDPAFDAWFERAVAPLPRDRFASVREMARAFQAIVRTLIPAQSESEAPGLAERELPSEPPTRVSAPDPSGPAGGASSVAPSPKSRKAAPVLIACGALCLALGALGALANRKPTSSSALAPATPLAGAVTPTQKPTAAAAPAALISSPAPAPEAARAPPALEGASLSVKAELSAAPRSTMTRAPPSSPAKKELTLKPPNSADPAKSLGLLGPKATHVSEPKIGVKPSAGLVAATKKKCHSVFIPCK